MISRLRGILLEKNPPQLLLEVQGIGYEVLAPLSSIFELPEVGEVVTLQTHFVVREDGHFLYGFLTERERQLFRLLLKVSGVGAKTALAILSNLEPQALIQSVLNEDVGALSRAPGVGRKTAERLIVEIRDRIASFEIDLVKSTGTSGANAQQTVKQDAIDALVALGYRPAEVAKRVSDLLKQQPQLKREELIRQVLKQGV